jgi:plastocyanin
MNPASQPDHINSAGPPRRQSSVPDPRPRRRPGTGPRGDIPIDRSVAGRIDVGPSLKLTSGVSLLEPTTRSRVAATRWKSTSIAAAVAGLISTVIYAGFEFHHFGVPDRVSLSGSTDTISVFHYPLIWFLLSVMFFGAFYAIGTVRGHRVRSGRGRRLTFGLSVVMSVLILIFYAVPLVSRLTIPAEDTATCSASAHPTTNPAVIHYSKGGGFCPVTVTVRSGTTVTFVADRGTTMRINSDYAGLTQREPAREFSTTLIKRGTFVYTDSPSSGSSLRKFISELLGRTQSHQGLIQVTESR